METNVKTSRTVLMLKPFDVFNDKATKNKIYRHLIDINDTITEEDIRNVKVAIPEHGIAHFSEEIDVPRPNRSMSPWDVLDAEA